MHIPLTGEFRIRSWTGADDAAIVKYADNRNVWINLRDSFPFPYTRGDAKAWLRKVTKQKPETHFAIASDKEAIGGIGLHPQFDVFLRSAEIGYWLGEPFWGQGIATVAVKAFMRYAFTEFALIHLYAGVFEWNLPSVRVLEKCGFRLEGRLRKHVRKDGKIADYFIYGVIREEASPIAP